MKARLPITLAVSLATLFSSAALVVACTEEDGATREPEGAPDAGPDVVANLPEASPPPEAGPDARPDPRPPFDPADEEVVCAGHAGACAVELVAGRNHFCARMSDGTVRCWGEDKAGAIGAPPDGGVPPAVRTIDGLSGVTQISAAGRTTCARLDDGTAKCWGDNGSAQLGALEDGGASADALPHPIPSPVAIDDPIARIDVGQRAACAVLASGKVYCWGDNLQQQIARPSSGLRGPVEIDQGGLALTKLSLGAQTSFGLTADGKVASWGAVSGGWVTPSGSQGLLAGRPASISPDATPVAIDPLHDVTSFAVSDTLELDEEGRLGAQLPPPPPAGGVRHAHACAIAAGEVYCWGRSDYGALCTGLLDAERFPAHAPIRSSKAWPQRIAVGDEFTCVRMTDGGIQCCGADHRGRLGSGFSPLFVPVEAFKGHAVQVATSHRAVCALVQGGSVECWGSNQYGELGQGSLDQDAHPTPAKVAF